jgi:hypothetical protein
VVGEAAGVRPQPVRVSKGTYNSMEAKILLGRNDQLLEVPQATWQQHLTQIPQHGQSRLSFMTTAHHQIRYFVVRAMADTQQPIAPEFISQQLNIPIERVQAILAELERKLFFLVRNEQGAVAWAYPVTVEPTPHRLNFSSGERLYGA